MATVLTVMNMKGGVGKTTVSMNLAGFAAAFQLGHPKPRRVLVIDYDPQFNLSQALLPAKTYYGLESKKLTILSVLLESDEDLNPYHIQVPGNENPPKVATLATRILSYKSGHLDLVPSTLNLMYVALGEADTSAKPIEARFHKFIQECRVNYDLIIIDCHPAGSIFTKTSLRNSDFVLIPVAPQRYAVRGIGLMSSFIEAKKQGASGPTPLVLFNLTSRQGISQEEAQIRADPKYAPMCLHNTMKRYSAFSDLDGGSGFVWLSKKPWSTEAFRNMSAVTKELLQRIGLAP